VIGRDWAKEQAKHRGEWLAYITTGTDDGLDYQLIAHGKELKAMVGSLTVTDKSRICVCYVPTEDWAWGPII
jgi:hypothetical protein